MSDHDDGEPEGGEQWFPRGSGFRWGSSVPVFRPDASTPLDEEQSDGVVPKVLLWAMRDHRRSGRRRRGEPWDEQVVGEGDGALYVIGSDASRATVGRLVGSSPDGCTYCLVAFDPCEELHVGDVRSAGSAVVHRAEDEVGRHRKDSSACRIGRKVRATSAMGGDGPAWSKSRSPTISSPCQTPFQGPKSPWHTISP